MQFKFNKKFLTLIIGFISLGVLVSGCSKGSADNKKTLTVGTTAQTYPNSYKKNDKLVGFDIDVTNAVAKKIGYKVRWKVIGDVPGLFGALDSGKIDTIANAVTVLPARQKNYNFSRVYSRYPAQIAVLKDSKYKSVKDLEGKTVSATIGSSNIDLLKKYNSKVNIKTYDDRNAVFTDANSGKVDGVLNQRQFLQTTIKKQKLNLRILKDVIGENRAAYPFKKKQDQKLRQKISDALKTLEKDGTLSKISKKYFNEDVTQK